MPVPRDTSRRQTFIGLSDAAVVFVRRGWRRGRVSECDQVFKVEMLYATWLRSHAPVFPELRGTATVIPDGRAWTEARTPTYEVVANRIWRYGRPFWLCGQCGRRATRLFTPLPDAEARCRRCWGLAYRTQSWSYHNPEMARINRLITLDAGRERRRAARQR